MSDAEEALAMHLRWRKIPFRREVAFIPGRRFRADFIIEGRPGPGKDALASAPLLVEIDGGAFVSGRHGRGAGIRTDMEKLNRATELGFRVLRFLPEHIEDGTALISIEACLGKEAQP